MTSTVGLVVNPTAGRGRGAAAGRAAAQVLRSRGVTVEDLSGPSAEAAAKLAADAVAEGLGALVVVGGDGVVHLGVGAVAGTRTALGIVPAGSGDDVARACGLPLGDPVAAAEVVARALAEGTTRSLDAARYETGTTSGWFAGVLAAGFDALVNERANGWRWPRGRMRYNLAVARELPVFSPRTYRLELDGEVATTRAMLVAVANSPSYGGGMAVAPDARLDDGLLDVVVLEPVGIPEFLRLFPTVFSGRHVDHPRVTVRRARRVRVESPGIVGYADGERLAPLPMTCTAAPGALRVLAPAKTPG